MTGVKLSDLLVEKASAEVQVGSAIVNIQFYVLVRQRFTDDEWDKLLALKGREYLKGLLPKVLISWDIVDDDGHAIPVTAEAIDQHEIPDTLLFAFEQRVFNSDLAGKVRTNGKV